MGNAAAELVFESSVIVRKSPSSLFWQRFRQDKAARCRRPSWSASSCWSRSSAGRSRAGSPGIPQNQTYRHDDRRLRHPERPERLTSGSAPTPKGATSSCATMYGARTSLFVGIVATGDRALHRARGRADSPASTVAVVDTALSRIADVLLAVPQMLIAVGIVAACSTSKNGCLGGLVQPGLTVVILVISFFSWSYIARIVRGYTLSLREKEFVEAARVARRERSCASSAHRDRSRTSSGRSSSTRRS